MLNSREQQTFLLKSQTVTILGFVGQIVSVATYFAIIG